MTIIVTNADWTALAPIAIVAVTGARRAACRFARAHARCAISSRSSSALVGWRVAACCAARQYGHDYAPSSAASSRRIQRRVSGDHPDRAGGLGHALRCDRPTQTHRRRGCTDVVVDVRRDADGRRGEPDDDFPGTRVAFARTVLFVRPGRSRDRARIGAEVSDSQLDRFGIFALRHGAALRRERQRAVRRVRQSRVGRQSALLDRHRHFSSSASRSS